ncbi:MAG: hydrogenase iron-sulfur subunit [Coriobacteriia bacterium]|nr:hydrogenase iron-sulfur subunit [Coriobacteriia bacterium]
MALGVYLSRCGGLVDAAIDVDEALANVREVAAVACVVDDVFDPIVVAAIESDIREGGVDAVVLAGNSAEHLSKSLSAGHLTRRLVSAGVNPNRIVVANLLEQVALAHPGDRIGATRKAAGIIDVAALFATMSPEVESIDLEPKRSVLVLGVTTEAMIAAQRLLQLGYEVVIADRGNGSATAASATVLKSTSAFVRGHARCKFIDGARLVDGDGWLGDYHIQIQSNEGSRRIVVGGILIARPDSAEWVAELREHFRVDVDDDGFARPLDPHNHPAETIDPGIMVVPVRVDGTAHRDKVAAADSVAMALVLRLSQTTVSHYGDTSAVDEALCGGCATCVRTCAFGACTLDENGRSHVDVRRCRGCGKCVVSCPVGARDIVSSPHDYLIEAVRSLSRVPVDVGHARVIGFLCGGCGYPAADAASEFVAQRGQGYPVTFMPLRIPCGGRLDTLYVLEAFKVGFDAVCVYRCRQGHCHNLIGNLDMDRRINLLRAVLRSRNIDDARLRIVDISPTEGERFVESVEEIYVSIASLTNGKGAAV